MGSCAPMGGRGDKENFPEEVKTELKFKYEDCVR